MSTITLDMLLDAATATLPNASHAEIGQLVADLVVKFDAELTPATIAPKPARKAKPKAAKTVVKKSVNKAANWQGYMMLADAGTATPKQVERLVGLGVKPAAASKLSMVKASNRYAALKGRI
jgi:hypothetical protein